MTTTHVGGATPPSADHPHDDLPGASHTSDTGTNTTAQDEQAASFVAGQAPTENAPATASAVLPDPRTVVVLATAGDPDVATRMLGAAAAVRSLGLPVRTVLINTGSPAPLASAGHPPAEVEDARTVAAAGLCWGAAVARGLAYARDVRVDTVVLLGPDEPADDPASPGSSDFAAAVTRLEAQKKPGVVCCPQARPWWQDPLSLHVLRPLCLPALGFAPLDPPGATLVLSAAAVTAALQPRWGLDHITGLRPHGLSILTAARHAGLTVSQNSARQPVAGHSRLADSPSISRGVFSAVLPAALRLCALAVPASRTSLPATRLPLTGAAVYPPPPGMLPQLAQRCADEARAGRAAADTWPEPLVTAWRRAHAPRADVPTLIDGLWPPYLRWLTSWYRDAADVACADPTQVLDHCVARAERAAKDFLDAIVLGSATRTRDGRR
ncbi:hypothetical protein L3Q67_25995 [Saccharothrix sp. AJ9571]|nr:hypothetical protein L3Q67_25995 [Saccharothrix sp. AJ9571]